MTIESIDIICTMLKHDGRYHDDPQAQSMWVYRNSQSGARLFAIFMTDWHDMYDSPFVTDPVLLWEHPGGLTTDGKSFLRDLELSRKASELELKSRRVK